MNETLRLLTVFKQEDPALYFRELLEKGILENHFPELNKLVGITQPVQFHPEGDVFEHTMQVLSAMRKMTDNPAWIYTALVHDLGKSITPKELLPKHHNHEKNGIPVVDAFNKRLQVPRDWADCALYGTEHHGRFHALTNMRPTKIGDFIHFMKESPLGLEGMMALGLADTRGKNKPNASHESVDFIRDLLSTIEFVDGMDISAREKRGKDIKSFLKTYKKEKPIS